MSGQDCGAPESVHGARPEKAPMVLPNVHGGSKVDQEVPPAAGPPPSSHGPEKGATAAATAKKDVIAPPDVVASFTLAIIAAYLFCVLVLHEWLALMSYQWLMYMFCGLSTMTMPGLMLAIGGARPGLMRMGRIVVVTGVLPSAGAWATCWVAKHAHWGGSGGGFAGYS